MSMVLVLGYMSTCEVLPAVPFLLPVHAFSIHTTCCFSTFDSGAMRNLCSIFCAHISLLEISWERGGMVCCTYWKWETSFLGFLFLTPLPRAAATCLCEARGTLVDH
ncbi:hypothetical protein C8R47DRAFT_719981 [Mycena vitilis]|nr:hypothetical protein C8R47DRAFT_719981 [Mycena vitilis]